MADRLQIRCARNCATIEPRAGLERAFYLAADDVADIAREIDAEDFETFDHPGPDTASRATQGQHGGQCIAVGRSTTTCDTGKISLQRVRALPQPHTTFELQLDDVVVGDVGALELSSCRFDHDSQIGYFVPVFEDDVGSQTDAMPDWSSKSVSVEHIFAKSMKRAAFDSEEDFEQFSLIRDQLQNLTLLERTLNAGLEDRSFKEKVETYERSAFALTRELGNTAEWTFAEASNRAEFLANLAVKAWPK